MTKKNVSFVMVVLVLVAIALYSIGGTYARYTSTASGTGEVQVAKWAVAINDEDVSASTASFDITFTEVTNDNVVDGKIAPASEVYAEFEIDPANSDVAMDYFFTLGDIESSNGVVPADLEVSKVVFAGTENEVEYDTENSRYTGTIDLVDQTKALTSKEAVKVAVYVKWTNNDDNSATDTSVGIDAPTLTMTVNATAQQHID